MLRKLIALGIVLVAVALVAVASMDAQLRITLFGFPQTSQSGSLPQASQSGSFSQTSASLLQIGYMRVVPYLIGAGGLSLIILGSTLSSRVEEEIDVQEPSQPPPWERPDIPNVKMEESNP